MKLPKNLPKFKLAVPAIATRAVVVVLPPQRRALIRGHLLRHFSRYTPGLWIWATATALLTFIAMLMVARIFLVGNNLSGQAIETGQRVLVDVANGEVEGNARHTIAVEKPPEVATIKTPPTPETPAKGDSRESPVEPVQTAAAADALAPAPLEAISAQTDKGLVPKIGADGTLPWKYYARPFTPVAKRPLVAIVITQLGLSKPRTEEALALPHNFTLSFSPYAGDARKWATDAREEGFETLVDLPMQSPNFLITGADPGPYGLLEESGANENSARLRWVLSRFSGYVGTLAPNDESLTGNIGAIRPTLIELAGHGVLFLYVKTPKNEGLADLSRARQFLALGIDKVIDDDIRAGPIGQQLDALTAIAKTQGYAIGFARPYPPTLAALTRWADSLSDQGVDLAPVSAVAAKGLP